MPSSNGHLVNRAAYRRYVLDRCRALRPTWGCTRVSAEALDEVEAHLRARTDARIHAHPSMGRTFRP
jgi:hypothetical protein